MSTYKRKRSYSSGPTKRRKTAVRRRPRRSNLKRTMRKTMMSLVETKKKEISYGNFEAYHNADPIFLSLSNSTIQPDDGDAYNQRIGDEICQQGFKIKMIFYNKADRPNLT